MQLVAMGAQDVYLTGNPQITFFKVVYRRHTNFSKECIAQTFSGSVPTTAEGSVTCTLARNGDLVQEIYLKAIIDANVTTGTITAIDHNTDTVNLGVSTLNNNQIITFDNNIMTTPTAGTNHSITINFYDGSGNNGAGHGSTQADPITLEIKITNNDDGTFVNGTITYQPTLGEKQPIVLAGLVNGTKTNLDDFTVTSNNTNYIIITANSSTVNKTLSFVNQQTQLMFAELVPSATVPGVAGGASTMIEQRPVQYLIQQHDAANNIYKLKKYTDNSEVTFTEAPEAGLTVGYTVQDQGLNTDLTNIINTVEVEIGGQKIDKHYSQWLDIYNELFETSHDLRFAMSNGSQIANNTKTYYIPLRFWFNRNPGLALPLIALQYHEVKINMTLNPARSAGAVTISDANLLVNYLYLDTDERRRFAQVSHEYLIEQVQHTGVENEGPITMNFNHPVKALFWTAPGATLGAAKIQLNGHDRAASQPHDYYHLVQPYENGLGHSGKSLNTTSRIWDYVVNTATTNNVGMYSFCLKPAEHQPSGTCNFSRIDNARLNLDGVSSSYGVYLFAMNYNVLRIMSGMGGLAYSN